MRNKPEEEEGEGEGAEAEKEKEVEEEEVYTAIEVSCGWAGAVIKKLAQAFG